MGSNYNFLLAVAAELLASTLEFNFRKQIFSLGKNANFTVDNDMETPLQKKVSLKGNRQQEQASRVERNPNQQPP